jgi:hypothetical protein
MLMGELFETQTIKRPFINLVDVRDSRKTGKTVRQFNTLRELQDCMIEKGRYFAKKSAYAGGVLKFILREILSTHVRVEGRRTQR